MKYIILLAVVLLSGCVSIPGLQNKKLKSSKEDQTVLTEKTQVSTAGEITRVIFVDSVPASSLNIEQSIKNCLPLGTFYVINDDLSKETSLYYKDTANYRIMPFPYDEYWAGFEEKVLRIMPIVPTRTVYVELAIKPRYDEDKYIFVRRSYYIDEYGVPETLKQDTIYDRLNTRALNKILQRL